MRKFIPILLPVVSVFLFLLTAETVVRFYHFLRWDISFIGGQPITRKDQISRLSPITLDAELGWRATENYHFDGMKHSKDGAEYAVNVSQNGNGFRMFGNPTSGKPRIFVIGDSFTQAVDASDDKTYYAIMNESLDVEVFAYGGGGYGSLQEFMILDKYLDAVRPNLILWQYSTNDFVNNSPDLELASSINNNAMVRPYWSDDHVIYVLPKLDGGRIRFLSLKYCRICYMIFNRVDRLQAAPTQTVETKTSSDGPAHLMFLRSLKITEEIMAKVRTRAGQVPIVAFIVGAGPPYGPEYEDGLKEISRRHGISLLDGIEETVLRAERSGTVVRASDGAHWNETGHRIAGRAIADSLKKTSLFLHTSALGP